ncbi:hypothetical protein E4U56_006833 [Claviceps arundinis]|uniref:Uncharacterized protein n=1 Tax=Claviceps arundinis TaxID=1623583 RepID=A0A9P7SLP0_9HYPO|nr:hypothetical protein E4U56_006833 [Claviceps arundinis]
MATPETSAFGGTNSKPTGLAAKKKLKPHDIDDSTKMPRTPHTTRRHARRVPSLDQFPKYCDCYRDEQARMNGLLSRTTPATRESGPLTKKTKQLAKEAPVLPWDNSQTVGESLLTPTCIFVKSLLPVVSQIKGLAHITAGEGLEEAREVVFAVKLTRRQGSDAVGELLVDNGGDGGALAVAQL